MKNARARTRLMRQIHKAKMELNARGEREYKVPKPSSIDIPNSVDVEVAGITEFKEKANELFVFLGKCQEEMDLFIDDEIELDEAEVDLCKCIDLGIMPSEE